VTGLSRVVRALPRDAHLLLLSSFLGSLPIGLLLVFFPLYLHDLGLRTLLIGGVFTAAPPVESSALLLVIGVGECVIDIEGLSNGVRQLYRPFRNVDPTGMLPLRKRRRTGRRGSLYMTLIGHQCQ